MTTEFASASYTAGQLNAIVKLLRKQAGTEDGPERFLRGELTVSEPTRSWREQDGIIYFSVTSDGTTGEEWITRLESKGFRVGENYTKNVLRSQDFKPTKGMTTEIAILKGTLFEDKDRVTSNIRADATGRKFRKPNAEVACLIREKFTDGEIRTMGLIWIVVMHEPIKDSSGGPSLLVVYRLGGGRCLRASNDGHFLRWDRGRGFAFAVSKIST